MEPHTSLIAWSPVISLVATLLLVGITAWYAWHTWRMAKASRDAADSSERAALAAEKSAVVAKDALAVARSDLRVEFLPEPIVGASSEAPALVGVRLQCTGATVFVHRVQLFMAVFYGEVEVDDEGRSTEPTTRLFGPVALIQDHDQDMPVQLHAGEEVILDGVLTNTPMVREGQHVGSMRLHIDYSLDGKGPIDTRTVDWGVKPWS